MTGQNRKQQIEALLQEDPHDPFLRYALAMEYVSSGDDASAVEHFTKLLREHPDYVPGYMQFGQTLSRLNRLDQARQVFEQGIAAALRTGDAHAAEEMQAMLAALT